MRFNLIFAVGLAVFVLTVGCGQHEQKHAEANPRSEQANADSSSNSLDGAEEKQVALPAGSPVIVTFGDSLTAGVAGRSYPAQLQDLLAANGYQYRIDNQGVSGDTTTDGLARIGNVAAAHPALVVLEFGGNDGLRGIPVNSTRKNLDEMITRLQSVHLAVVLLGITLPPNYGVEYVKPFTAMFPALAKQHKIPVFPFLLAHVYQNGELMQPDGIHPNGQGNAIVAKDVFELIRPLLKKQP